MSSVVMVMRMAELANRKGCETKGFGLYMSRVSSVYIPDQERD